MRKRWHASRGAARSLGTCAKKFSCRVANRSPNGRRLCIPVFGGPSLLAMVLASPGSCYICRSIGPARASSAMCRPWPIGSVPVWSRHPIIQAVPAYALSAERILPTAQRPQGLRAASSLQPTRLTAPKVRAVDSFDRGDARNNATLRDIASKEWEGSPPGQRPSLTSVSRIRLLSGLIMSCLSL